MIILKNSNFDKYLKKIRKYYGDKFNFALQCANKYIDYEYVLGDGGLHLFFKLKDIIPICTSKCYRKRRYIYARRCIFYK